MSVSVLDCQYRPRPHAGENSDRRGSVMIMLKYRSRTRKLIAPISRITEGTDFVFDMPIGWGDLFGTETGYTKALVNLMSRVVEGDQLTFPIEIERD